MTTVFDSSLTLPDSGSRHNFTGEGDDVRRKGVVCVCFVELVEKEILRI